MSNNEKLRGLVPQEPTLPIEARWAKKAAGITGPLAAFVFGVQARANMRALQVATEHAKVVGELMDTAAETLAKMQRAQDVAREHAVRQELFEELRQGEVERLLDTMAEARHQRTLSAKRRLQEEVKADTEVLLARQTLRAKRKFEPLKHALGEERFKTEAARRRVGAAEAEFAIGEAGIPPAPLAPAGDPVATDKMARAAVVSELLQGVRLDLKEARADDQDGERRAQLLADETSLERMLAALLKP
jgi:hypothetical protein